MSECWAVFHKGLRVSCRCSDKRQAWLIAMGMDTLEVPSIEFRALQQVESIDGDVSEIATIALASGYTIERVPESPPLPTSGDME